MSKVKEGIAILLTCILCIGIIPLPVTVNAYDSNTGTPPISDENFSEESLTSTEEALPSETSGEIDVPETELKLDANEVEDIIADANENVDTEAADEADIKTTETEDPTKEAAEEISTDADSETTEETSTDADVESTEETTPSRKSAPRRAPSADDVAAIGDTGYATLQAAIDASQDENTILLLKNITETIISTNKSYTLDMQDNTITAQSGSNCITINGGTVTIKNGTITGGNSAGSGAGVSILNNSSANVTFDNVIISNNQTTNSGGAIFVGAGNTLTLNSSAIENNTCRYYGGGIYVNGATVYIKDSTITGNESTDARWGLGGGIGTATSGNSSTIVIEDSIISNNKDGSTGGGISHRDNANSTLTIKNSTISENTSGSAGGGIYSIANVDIDNTDISNNKTQTGNSNSHGGGIAIGAASSSGSLNITNSDISGNYAAGQGGGIYCASGAGNHANITNVKLYDNESASARSAIAGVLNANNAGITIKDSAIENNESTGGDQTSSTIFFQGNTSQGVVDNCSITNNTSLYTGGIMVNSANVEVKNSVVTGNSATATTARTVNGVAYEPTGGISVILRSWDAKFVMNSGVLRNNTTASSKDANDLYISPSLTGATLNVLRAKSMQNNPTNDYIWKDIQNNINNVNDPLVIANAATSIAYYYTAIPENPQGIFLGGSNGNDSNSGANPQDPVATFAKAKELLEQNSQFNTIYIVGEVNVNDEQTWELPEGKRIVRYSGYKGDLIHIRPNGNLTLKNVTIDGASLPSEGALNGVGSIIFVDGGRLTLDSGSVLQNNNKMLGYVYNYGGAVRNNNGAVNVKDDSTIKNCKAMYGGGIYSNGPVNMSGGTITENRAEPAGPYKNGYRSQTRPGHGGGICMVNNGALTLTGGEITNNWAVNGGGISLGGNDTVSIQNSTPTLIMKASDDNFATISSNTADNDGGGLFVQYNAEANISAGKIINNDANASYYGPFGGGVYVNGGLDSRDGVALTDGKLILINTIISDNTSFGRGSGIAGCPSASVKIYVKDGGAIYDNSSKNRTYGPESQLYLSAESSYGTTWKGTPGASITDVSLGVGLHNWIKLNDDGTRGETLSYNSLTSLKLPNNTFEHYTTNVSDADKAKAELFASVWITGNTSQGHGGGIGTNGEVIIGTESGSVKLDKHLINEDKNDNTGDGAGDANEPEEGAEGTSGDSFTFTIELSAPL